MRKYIMICALIDTDEWCNIRMFMVWRIDKRAPFLPPPAKKANTSVNSFRFDFKTYPYLEKNEVKNWREFDSLGFC